ncbi:GGDEF domain-containing protein [Butyrivibrio sp.]|uniref:GGDEF domain-containing protein n=1 Tax=Butyrivibrio sp. TaxID=28121 RepID=UPI0025BAAFC3|nr:diguanylate cyclase [Butyrivibrio sp.]MBQ9305650.1 sensor domain-containing diguanylate cyclase [Butyrivibrio sp.]
MINRYQNYAGDAINFLCRCIDVDDLEECMRTGVKSEKYEELQLLANNFKETHDLYFIYIIEPLKADPPDNMMDVFAAYTSWGKADGTDGLTDLGNYTGDAYPREVALQYMQRMDNDTKVTYFRNDTDFGRIYTAIRPLINSKGEPIAVICGDILIDDIYNAAYTYAITTFIVALVAGFLIIMALNHWYNRRLVHPIKNLENATGEIEAKCRRRAPVSELVMNDLNIHTHDEIESLSGSIASMVEDIRNYASDLIDNEKKLSAMEDKASQLEALANRDSLTGIRNKTAYDNEIKSLEYNLHLGNTDFGIGVVDLNYLKVINDTYGHEKGNEAIKNICRIVCVTFAHSPVFRVGGDEFAIILKDHDLENIDSLVEKFNNELAALAENKDLQPWEAVSAAIGYATYDADKDAGAVNVFKRADNNMYENKKKMHAARQ